VAPSVFDGSLLCGSHTAFDAIGDEHRGDDTRRRQPRLAWPHAQTATSVSYDTDKISVTPTANESSATITVNDSAVPSGTTSQAISLEVGSNPIAIEVTGSDDTTKKTYTIDVTRKNAEIVINPASIPDGQVGVSYGPVYLEASGGIAPYSWGWGHDIPPGLSLNAGAPATLSGTPQKAGTYNFGIRVIDQKGSEIEQEFTVTFAPQSITINPVAISNGAVGQTYGPVSFSASGGTGPYTFSISDGDLPDGITLSAVGSLSGTPTKAGQFTVTISAKDATGVTGSQEIVLSISAPDIVVSVPSLPDGKVNAAYSAVQLAASGGTAPYGFTVSAGKLPQGVELATDGTLSGTPTEAGDFAVTIAATDRFGFTGTVGLSITIKGLDVPVARDMTLEIMIGTTGSVDLTRGATNGPFTAADIAVHPAAEAGKASVRQNGAAYMLDFEAAGTFAGSASLQYTLSNADGRSAPATVTLNVIARPDPSQDPEVIGLLTAQTEAARRFAKTKIQNFNRRLEQLHDEGDLRRNSMNVSIGMIERDSDKTAYAEDQRDRDRVADAFRRMDSRKGAEKSATGQDAYNPLGNFAIWTGGYVNFAIGTYIRRIGCDRPTGPVAAGQFQFPQADANNYAIAVCRTKCVGDTAFIGR